MQGLLQQREAECRQVAAQNIALQMKNEELHGEQSFCAYMCSFLKCRLSHTDCDDCPGILSCQGKRNSPIRPPLSIGA